MKIKLLILLVLITCVSAYAGSATWNLNPGSSDWNTATNWTPATIPNGPTDIAAFDVSNVTNLVIKGSSRAIDTVDHIEFTTNSSAFTITVESDDPPFVPKLIFDGTGIINESGMTQTFVAMPSPLSFGPPLIEFHNRASAGENTVFTSANGFGTGVEFFDNSDAGTATFALTADIVFDDDSSAASATIMGLVDGEIQFLDNSTAANGTLVVEGGNGFGSFIVFLQNSTAGWADFTVMSGEGSGGEVDFNGSASADHGAFEVEGASSKSSRSGKMFFFGTATAGDATITLQGGLTSQAAGAALHFFRGSSTAGNSTITAENGVGPESGGLVVFDGGTTGGAARVELLGPAGPGTLKVELSAGDEPVAVGSIEGSGRVIIASASGGTTLAIGSNDLSTIFSGLIQDGVAPGSIAKIGTGTLTLTGANSYTGGTMVTSGVLLVSNAGGAGTGTGAVIVNGGTLGGGGIIAGAVTIGTNTNTASFLAPSKGAKRPATLAIQSALTLNDDSTYVYKLDTKHRVSDQVLAQDVTIDNGAKFSLRASGTTQLPLGQVFTVISNTAATSISGRFHNLADGAIVKVNNNNLQASYSGGDGNDLTLTVVP